jgi:hypothetical protein
MKLQKITIIVLAAALVLVIGAVIVYVVVKAHSNSPEPNALAATPATQNTSSPTVNAGLPALSGAKDISDAKDLVQSVTEGEIAANSSVARTPSDQSTGYFYRSFVIKFKQDMDAGTLNAQNIPAYADNNLIELSCKYNTESRELQIDIKLDYTQIGVTGKTTTVYVLLTKGIKTADGRNIDHDYVYSYRT